MTKQEIEQHIKAIKSNYPSSNYTILREALDYALDLMEQEIKKIKGVNEND